MKILKTNSILFLSALSLVTPPRANNSELCLSTRIPVGRSWTPIVAPMVAPTIEVLLTAGNFFNKWKPAQSSCTILARNMREFWKGSRQLRMD